MRKVEVAKSVDLRWPHLNDEIGAPVRGALARHLFLHSVRSLPLQVIMPNAKVYGLGQGDFRSGGDPSIRILDPAHFFARLGKDGALGFGESYLLGTWEPGRGPQARFEASNELVAWLKIYARALRRRESDVFLMLRSLWLRSLPVSEKNSISGARRNIEAHYDLDPQLFRLFLDPFMVYSSALFNDVDNQMDVENLALAQKRKITAMLDLAHVGNGTRLLDVGSGFGGLAIQAACERSAKVTGITISRNQLEYALDRVEREGLGESVKFLAEDYRKHVGTYDSVVSVEMIEAVGAGYWKEYFTAIDRLLVPGGRFGLQVIAYPHLKMKAAKRDFSWVDRYIFPGGALPSLREIDRIVRLCTNLEIIETRRLSESYARTLRVWRRKFLEAEQEVRRLRFDDTFIRLWTLYFSYFEAGFRARYCDVWQIGFVKNL